MGAVAEQAPSRRGRRVAVGVLALCALAVGVAGFALADVEAPPRSVAAFLDAAADGPDPPPFDGTIRDTARLLRHLDRGDQQLAPLPALTVGAQAAPVTGPWQPGGREVRVASIEAARRAFDAAEAGDVIVFEPGTYRIAGSGLAARRPGHPTQPIVVRAEQPDDVVLEIAVVEGINVSAPYWTIENLTLRGVCPDDNHCEHAFHVVAGATHFVARNNTLVDFNAHIKVNGQDGLFPDHGLIEGNTLTANRPRDTDKPVTDVDIVAASGWTVRANRITDFVKARGDRVSYGAFFKGGGAGNRFERNLVVCEERLRDRVGARVGLSLGGGGTYPGACRDGRCITEQDGGVLDSNLIATCSDDGIYLNRAATSVVVHNTLVDTGGLVVRFPDSGAVVEGNLVDGALRTRDEGALHASDNLQTGLTSLFLGRHPVRDLFDDADRLELGWRATPPRRQAVATKPAATDLCGQARPELPTYGAFENFARCRAAAPGVAAPP